MKKKVLYAGTFDPITKGHLDIIRRASALFDEIIVGIAVNTRKKPLLTALQRLTLIQKAIKDLPNVTVTYYEGMTVKYAKTIGADVLLRGLRTPADFQMEFQMAVTNRTLEPKLETVFFISAPEYAFINSCLVREVAKSGGAIAPFVPESIHGILEELLKEQLKGADNLPDNV